MEASNAKQTSTGWMYILLALIFTLGVYFSGLDENMRGVHETSAQTLQKKEHHTGNNDHPLPPLAWLMSFPNSGTSYTMQMFKKVTSLRPASNYGQESVGEHGLGVSLFTTNDTETLTAGPPFWISPTNPKYKNPSKGYILTKTHCGSRCQNCSVSKYLESYDLFLKQCLEGSYNVKDDDGRLTKKVGSYNKELVQRAVHLIRDPFDNVVSRFHLYNKHHATAYPRTREGFRKFCSDEGKRYYSEEQQSKFYHAVFDTVKDVPCHADFYRYIQWHNLAFITTWNLGIPSLIIHYENYTDNFKKTQDTLLDFLGQDALHDAPEFVTGKTYREYYMQEEIDAVHVLFSKLALEKTWTNIQHYFEK